MNKIVNLTQHKLTQEQIDELTQNNFEIVNIEPMDIFVELNTFTELPTPRDLHKRAMDIVKVLDRYDPTHVLIGGAGYFMGVLESTLRSNGISPLHAFTLREAVETVGENGKVIKTSVFKHKGFIGSLF